MPIITDPLKRERNAQAFFGCSEHAAMCLNDGLPLRSKGSKALAYLVQRQAAKKRDIDWLLTFEEWLAIWMASGSWENRGCGIGKFCMARHGDTGPYAAANVSIQSSQQNSFDGGFGGKAKGSRKQVRNAGGGRGWTFTRGRFQVMVGKTYVGTFASQGEAEASYQSACAVHNASKVVASSHDHFFARR